MTTRSMVIQAAACGLDALHKPDNVAYDPARQGAQADGVELPTAAAPHTQNQDIEVQCKNIREDRCDKIEGL
jgi:hypothetical protein